MKPRTLSNTRLDQALVDQNLVASLSLAQSWIMAGNVLVNQQRINKPGTRVKPSDILWVKPMAKYVSRGGDKLAHALQAFNLSVDHALCLDVGASTGGFTDCLLQNGASHVVAVDVGTNQLDWSLRQNSQVTSIEQTHIRDFDPLIITTTPCMEGFDWVVADVSFINLMTVIPYMVKRLKPLTGQLITLLKPQFEFTRYVGENRQFNGVVTQPADLHAILEGFYQEALALPDIKLRAMALSPLKGAKGNTEYLLWWTVTDLTRGV